MGVGEVLPEGGCTAVGGAPGQMYTREALEEPSFQPMAKAMVLDGPVLCMHKVSELQPHGDTLRRLSSETYESAGTWGPASIHVSAWRLVSVPAATLARQ